MSLPLRERGLKYLFNVRNYLSFSVAPLAGAWIEICFIRASVVSSSVAPLAGAWIEINISCDQVRKPMVAPLAGAWIEMQILRRPQRHRPSLPLRERGLKSFPGYSLLFCRLSLPLRERGLKFHLYALFRQPLSRSPCGSVD